MTSRIMTVALALVLLAVPRIAVAEDVTYFDAKQVAASFAKATTLFAHDNYRIVTGRRVKPGEVEIHALDTDLMYVVSGSATLVTGGTPVAPRDSAPNEVRAKSSTGGTPRKLSKGDVIIIPKGTPHWFEQVSGTFDYLTIKVR